MSLTWSWEFGFVSSLPLVGLGGALGGLLPLPFLLLLLFRAADLRRQHLGLAELPLQQLELRVKLRQRGLLPLLLVLLQSEKREGGKFN